MFLPDLARDIFPDWNERPKTMADCFEYCRQRNISVYFCEDDREEYGYYEVKPDGEEVRMLNRHLDPQMLLWVFLHEVFHSRAHYPETSHFSRAMVEKNDAEANDAVNANVKRLMPTRRR